MRESSDHNLVRRELYNPNKFDLIFKLDARFLSYIESYGRWPGRPYWVLKSESWQVVPHFYWIIDAANGAPTFDLIQNFGKAIGIGNKLPSLPVVDNQWQDDSP